MISVAMTTFNGEKYIEKQIESILNQSLSVDEIIICDDGSTDNTIELMKKYNVQIIQNKKNLGYKLNFKKQWKNVRVTTFFYVIKMIYGKKIKLKK